MISKSGDGSHLHWARIARKLQARSGQGNFSNSQGLVLGSLIAQNLVPIHLQVCADANPMASRRQLMGEINHDSSRQAGWKTHIVQNSHPAAAAVQSFQIRWNRADA